MTADFSHDEQEFIAATAAGNQKAFKALVDMYWRKVYGHALAYCHSVHEAEELTQDVFMAIWMNREKLPLLNSFANYLFIIARNKILKAIRKKLIHGPISDNIPLLEGIWLPDKQLELREIDGIILQGVELLPPMRKRVFIMSRFEGMSYEQICSQLGVSRNTVKEHMIKALNFLRNYFIFRHSGLLLFYSLLIAASIFF